MWTKSSLRALPLLVAVGSLLVEAYIPRSFHVVLSEVTCDEALAYCREKHTDLATILSAKEGENVPKCGTGTNHGCYIGLHRDHGQLENWIWPWGKKASYSNWASVDEENGIRKHSVTVLNKKWHSVYCSAKRNFICEDVKLFLVRENKTWEEALDHCRALQADLSLDYNTQNALYDLPSLQTKRDLYYARRMIQNSATDQVWTGLRFLGSKWLWVNSDSLWHQDIPTCPTEGRYCGTLSKYGDAWDIRDCQERKNFLCYKRSLKYKKSN